MELPLVGDQFRVGSENHFVKGGTLENSHLRENPMESVSRPYCNGRL